MGLSVSMPIFTSICVLGRVARRNRCLRSRVSGEMLISSVSGAQITSAEPLIAREDSTVNMCSPSDRVS